MRVAIIHDWLFSQRGGENVLAAICELFPQADLYTIFYRPKGLDPIFQDRKITASFLNTLPKVEKYYRYLLPFFPMAVERWDLSHYDLIISSSTCAAKGVLTSPHSLHVSYCNTTMRYVWDQYRAYFPRGLKDWLVFPWCHYLRMWDVTSSARVDQFFANSTFIQARIQKYWRRDSTVVHPFVDLEKFPLSTESPRGNHYLVVSALVPYKRIELAVEACRKLNRELWIVGDGPLLKNLRKLAGPQTVFLGSVSSSRLSELYQGARALIFPGEEDFGIVPLEAMASGTPVIAFGRGGVLDTVLPGKTGCFFTKPDFESLAESIESFEKKGDAFSRVSCRTQAEKFSKQRFKDEFMAGLKKWGFKSASQSLANEKCSSD
jgi:glycosyltransferase involved in cell wall biosynthesis